MDMKEHRKRIRERQRLNKQPIIPPHNEYNIKDLTPHNATRVMRGMDVKYK